MLSSTRCAPVNACACYSFFLLQPRCSLTRVPPVHPGSFLKDLALWCCCPCCALVQETRTLALNNVRGGEWHGPTRFVVPMAAPVEVTKA